MTRAHTEATLTRLVLAQLQRLPGVFAWRANAGAARTSGGRTVRFGAVGQPDIMCVVAGRFLGLETKSATGKQSPGQARFQAALEASGGRYALVRTLDEALKVVAFIKDEAGIRDMAGRFGGGPVL
jgi:hypothetical protein